MISYKENLHKFYRHECPDFIPDMRRDFSRVNYAFGKYESHPPMGENGYDGYGVYWFFEPKNRAHMPLQDPKTGKYKLSHRVLIEKPEGYVERPARRERPERGERRPRPERGERRDRGDRGDRRERPDRGERRPRPEYNNDEYHDPAENREPRDFSDALDHMDF